MARKSKPSDFKVTVENVGSFTFARRSMADEFAIQRKYADLTGGLNPTMWLDNVATWVSALAVLTVTAPESWDIDTMDPLDDDTYLNLKSVYDELKESEDSFRGKSGKGSEADSKAPLNND